MIQFLRYKNLYLRKLQIWISSEQQDHLLEICEKQKTVRKWRALFRGTDGWEYPATYADDRVEITRARALHGRRRDSEQSCAVRALLVSVIATSGSGRGQQYEGAAQWKGCALPKPGPHASIYFWSTKLDRFRTHKVYYSQEESEVYFNGDENWGRTILR